MSDFLLFALPAFGSLGLWLVRPSARASRFSGLAVGGVLAFIAIRLLIDAADGSVRVQALGAWAPPLGIAFAVDRLAAIFVMLHAVLLLVVLLPLRQEIYGETVVQRAVPLLLMLSAGLFAAFLTADLFNLFVIFELVLIASYLLLQVPGSKRSLAATLPTVVLNLVASLLFLGGLGVLYGIGGSVNVADLSIRLAEAPPEIRRVGLLMLITAFAAKAAVVPLCFWMPGAYPTLSAPLAALFAGIMTKLGVYALLRIQPLVALDPWLGQLLLWMGALTALVGVLAALSQYELRRLLAFHSISQVGFMLTAIGLGSAAGVASAVFFAVHHSLVKAALYLVAGDLERENGTRDLRHMNARHAPHAALVTCFIAAAFSLAGMPPFSGFFGKLGVFRAVFEGGAWVALVLLVFASIFTLASMLKIWRFAFQPTPGEKIVSKTTLARSTPLLTMVVLILALGLNAGHVYDYCLSAATALIDGSAYNEAVLVTAAGAATSGVR